MSRSSLGRVCLGPGWPRSRGAVPGRAARARRTASFAPLAVAVVAGALIAGGCSPSTSPAVSTQPPPVLTVQVRGEAGTVLELTVRDRSNATLSARSATLEELRAHDPALADANAAIRSLDSTHILLIWLGTPCDRSATLDIDPAWTSLQLQQGPRPTCDLVGDPRGVVLVTREAVPVEQAKVLLLGR